MATPSTTKKPHPVICVFCGASPGTSDAHMKAGRALGTLIAKSGATLVYGGGTRGVMAAVAESVLEISGPDAVHGVIPEALMRFEAPEREDAHGDGKKNGSASTSVEGKESSTTKEPTRGSYGRTTLVKDMHTRKSKMASLVLQGGPGSGFVALSGGFGTLEELFEVITWNQLGIHELPVVLYSVEGFYDKLMDFVDFSVKAGFIVEKNAGIVVSRDSAEGVMDALRTYVKSEARLALNWEEK